MTLCVTSYYTAHSKVHCCSFLFKYFVVTILFILNTLFSQLHCKDFKKGCFSTSRSSGACYVNKLYMVSIITVSQKIIN